MKLHPLNLTESRFTFTTKAPREGNRTPMNKIKYSEERDAETGYGYFGARYYDIELSGLWLSVDPMADKYPGISPYAYCAWNPVKLIDPDGEDVVLHESAKIVHDKYYGKKGYEEYTNLFDKLNNDHSILVPVLACNDNKRSKNERAANGSIFESDNESDNYSNGCFEIEWGTPGNYYGGTEEHVYMEEMCHMGQAKDDNYNIYSMTIDKEYQAKQFSINNCNDIIKDTYDDIYKGGYEIPTELSIIRDYDANQAKTYLKEGMDWDVKRMDRSSINQKIGGYYDYLQE